MTELTATHF